MQTPVYIPCTFRRKKFAPIETREELAIAHNNPDRIWSGAEGQAHRQVTEWLWETVNATIIAFVASATYSDAWGYWSTTKAVVLEDGGRLHQMDLGDVVVLPSPDLVPAEEAYA